MERKQDAYDQKALSHIKRLKKKKQRLADLNSKQPAKKVPGGLAREPLASSSSKLGSQQHSHVQNKAYMEDFEGALEKMGVTSREDEKPKFKRRKERPERSTASRQSSHSSHGQLVARNSFLNTTVDKGSSDVGVPNPLLFSSPPTLSEGLVLDAADRPMSCGVLTPWGEVVVGCTNHSLYCVNPLDESRVGLTRELHSKRYGHSEWVTSVTFTTGNRVVSGGMDGKLCMWDAPSTSILSYMERSSSSSSFRPVAIVPCIELEGHTHSVSQVVTLYPSSYILSASYDETIKLWDCDAASSSRRSPLDSIASLEGHTAPVMCLDTRQGSIGAVVMVISGSRDGTVLFWKVHPDTTDALVRPFFKAPQAHEGHVTLVRSVPSRREEEGVLFVSGGQDGILCVWRVNENEEQEGGGRSALLRPMMKIRLGGRSRESKDSASRTILAVVSIHFYPLSTSSSNSLGIPDMLVITADSHIHRISIEDAHPSSSRPFSVKKRVLSSNADGRFRNFIYTSCMMQAATETNNNSNIGQGESDSPSLLFTGDGEGMLLSHTLSSDAQAVLDTLVEEEEGSRSSWLYGSQDESNQEVGRDESAYAFQLRYGLGAVSQGAVRVIVPVVDGRGKGHLVIGGDDGRIMKYTFS